MMSFRVPDDEAARVQRWAEELGIDKSELLREALHRHLTRLASVHDAVTWVDHPLTADEGLPRQATVLSTAEFLDVRGGCQQVRDGELGVSGPTPHAADGADKVESAAADAELLDR